MPDRIEQAARVVDTASRALTLVERIAARLGRGTPQVRATWLRLRAIKHEKRATTALSARARTNAAASAAADRAAADVLDPPTACPKGQAGKRR